MAFHLDGKVSAVVGTHTHVQTADEKILPGKTAYITDQASAARLRYHRFRSSVSIAKQLTQMPLRTEIANTAPLLQGFT